MARRGLETQLVTLPQSLAPYGQTKMNTEAAFRPNGLAAADAAAATATAAAAACRSAGRARGIAPNPHQFRGGALYWSIAVRHGGLGTQKPMSPECTRSRLANPRLSGIFIGLTCPHCQLLSN